MSCQGDFDQRQGYQVLPCSTVIRCRSSGKCHPQTSRCFSSALPLHTSILHTLCVVAEEWNPFEMQGLLHAAYSQDNFLVSTPHTLCE